MQIDFICPICKDTLFRQSGSLLCGNGHCFDISKYGYVNLLSSSGKKGHGDDKLMVKARRDFLNKGYYEHLRNALCHEAEKYAHKGFSLLDSGCGEGYYTNGLYDVFIKKQGEKIFGIDVSKEALKLASKNCTNVQFAVSSAYCLPFNDSSFNIVTSLFAPLAVTEFRRVLKNDGIFLTVIPLENHLFSLKKYVYDAPYKNKPQSTELEGFRLINSSVIKKDICLKSQEDISNLFKMTPYYYKTSEKDQEKLNYIDKLKVETEFMILTYIKSQKSL